MLVIALERELGSRAIGIEDANRLVAAVPVGAVDLGYQLRRGILAHRAARLPVDDDHCPWDKVRAGQRQRQRII